MTLQAQTKNRLGLTRFPAQSPFTKKVFSDIHKRPSPVIFSAKDKAQTETKESIRRTLSNGIQNILEMAKTLPPDCRVAMVREKLVDIQQYCSTVGKTFIVVEENIGCHQYDLNGSNQDQATLFRGPDERATVAICVTQKGSLMLRNGPDWVVYRNGGDVLAPA